MAVMKPGALEGWLRRRDPLVGVLLIHGPDASAIRDLAVRAVKAVAGNADDPFNVVTLDESAVSADPGRVVDEVQSLSMMGGNRVVWVRGAEQSFLREAEPILAGKVSGNLIIAEAGNLAKTSTLRVAVEESPHGLALAAYEAEQAATGAVLEARFSKAGFGLSDEALGRLLELVGRTGTFALREAEKLMLYVHGQKVITLEDVEAICGDGVWAGTDDLADAAFSGELERTDMIFSQLATSGIDAGRMLMAVHAHALRLSELRLMMDRGAQAEQAVRSARPPIFFKRQNGIKRQLSGWSSEGLLSAATTLGTAIVRARLDGGLADAIANRTLLGIARESQRQRG